MIDAYLAWSLRRRGLLLPVDGSESYATPRLEEIARRQQELRAELDALDKEIQEAANSMVKR